MTSTYPAPGNYTPTFPEHPEDGFEVIEKLGDGRLMVWAYKKALNAWNSQIISPDSPATEGWVQGQGYVKGPVKTRVGFTDKYNGNRYYKPGQETTSLSEGEVMFLQDGVSTEAFLDVTHVALPEAGIDWTKFTRIGTIEVRNGSTVCGYLQVVHAKQNPGRNWIVKVNLLELVNNELSPETGHPCYFWGMFTE